jgi:UDP-3-O-[3-hydroxymyristoyl] glucosamine N-acyltransferase
MRFSYTLEELIKLLGPQARAGDTQAVLTEISSLSMAQPGAITFLGNLKYRKNVENSRASVILLPLNCEQKPKENQCFLFFDNPSFALGILCRAIERKYYPRPPIGIHSTAVIDESVSIGRNVSIGAHVVIEADSQIGDNVTISVGCYLGHQVKVGGESVIHPSVKIMDFCEIGARVNLFPGAVIGSDGFGYETVDGVHEKLPQIGNVVIEDDVDIGANTTIDRARFGSTAIGQGTKIDNLVQIGHNVTIGKGCIIVAQTGISGSTVIGNYVVIGGQVGIAGHVTIPNGIMVAGQSSITAYKHSDGQILRGSPAMPIGQANRIYVLLRRLPNLFSRVSSLEEELRRG